MNNLNRFQSFAKVSKGVKVNSSNKAVIYTRVSTKEQAENNASLATQKKYCDEYAERNGYDIIEYFGGTYESAKSDERKQFQKMLAFVRKAKNIQCIIVYSYDRFTRTGANGAYISEQLKTEGVVVLSATQQIDVQSSAGAFQQNLYFMFGQFDNEIRREKSVTGMKEKLRRGYWMGKVPFGYTNINPGKRKEQEYTINEEGEGLKLAFDVKANTNLNHIEIAERLKRKGYHIPAKRLTEYFRRPFYCGVIVSSHIPNEIIEGKHPPIVSKEVFLKVNGMLESYGNGLSTKNLDDQLPLKKFMRSDVCGTPYTGYIVKNKGIFYYKNPRKGAGENRNANVVHNQFKELLKQYALNNENLSPIIEDMMYNIIREDQKEQLKDVERVEKEIIQIDSKIERLEERFVFEEITKEQYEKFRQKLVKEKLNFEETLSRTELDSSNLEKAIKLATSFSVNLPDKWSSGNLDVKRAIQNMVFPAGINYDYKNDKIRVVRTNPLFSIIPDISRDLEHKKN